MSTQNKYRLCILALVICGLLMVYSSSHIWAEYKFEDELYYFKRQAFFCHYRIGFDAHFFKDRLSFI